MSAALSWDGFIHMGPWKDALPRMAAERAAWSEKYGPACKARDAENKRLRALAVSFVSNALANATDEERAAVAKVFCVEASQ